MKIKYLNVFKYLALVFVAVFSLATFSQTQAANRGDSCGGGCGTEQPFCGKVGMIQVCDPNSLTCKITGSHYGDSGGTCTLVPNGNSNCTDTCTPQAAPGATYSCSGSSCVSDPTGSYSDSGCGGACNPVQCFNACGDGYCCSSAGETQSTCSDDCGGSAYNPPAECGTASGQAYSTAPSTQSELCTIGSYGGLTQTSSDPLPAWKWTCTNAVRTVDCSTLGGAHSCNGSPFYAASILGMAAPQTVSVNQVFSATVVVQNDSNQDWNAADVHLVSGSNYWADAPQWNMIWGLNRVNTATNFPSCATYTYTFNATAPSTPGTYPFGWNFWHDAHGEIAQVRADVVVKAGPTATLSGTNYGSASPVQGSVVTYYGGTSNLTWTSSNVSSCSLFGTNGDSVANAIGTTSMTTSAITGTVNYTLNCIGTNGSPVSDTLSVNVPPAPTGAAASCPSPGTAAVLSWTAPASGGSGVYYVRNRDNTTGGTALAWNENYSGTTYNIPNSYPGLEYPGSPTPGHNYTMWIHNKDTATGAWSNITAVDYNCGIAAPTASIQANGTSGSITITTNTSATISWNSTNTSSCTVASSPTGFSGSGTNNVGTTTGNLTANTTYTLSCTGLDNSTKTDSVTVNVANGPPGGGNSNNITTTANTCPAAASITVGWTGGSGATSYKIYRNTTGGAPVAGDLLVTTGNVLSYLDNTATNSATKYYYWVESVGGDGTKVPANSNSAGGIAPNQCVPTPGPVCNSSNAAPCTPYGGVAPSCNQIKVTWTDVATPGATYKVFKDGIQISGSIAASTEYFIYTTPDNNPHNYGIASTVGGVNSAIASAGSGTSFSCSADLSTSDKDITAINYVPINPVPTPCNNQTDSLPASTTLFKPGDVISFQVNLCNNAPASGGLAATRLTMVDVLTYLIKPASGWNAKYCNGGACSTLSEDVSSESSCPNPSPAVGKFAVCGSTPNQSLTFNLTSNSYNVPINNPPPGIRNLKIDAQVAASAAPSLYGRFQNFVGVTYNSGSKSINTPFYLFYGGNGVPTRGETP